MTRTVSLLLALLVASALFAETKPGSAGIVHHKDAVFGLHAPEGWTLDNSSGLSQGLAAVVYPNGTTWADATVVMYANVASKDIKGNETVAALMEADAEGFRKRSPKLRTLELAAIGDAKVRKFEGDEHGNTEAVAYIDTPRAIVLLVLSARNSNEFLRAWPSFEKLVTSYRFLSSDARSDSR